MFAHIFVSLIRSPRSAVGRGRRLHTVMLTTVHRLLAAIAGSVACLLHAGSVGRLVVLVLAAGHHVAEEAAAATAVLDGLGVGVCAGALRAALSQAAEVAAEETGQDEDGASNCNTDDGTGGKTATPGGAVLAGEEACQLVGVFEPVVEIHVEEVALCGRSVCLCVCVPKGAGEGVRRCLLGGSWQARKCC